MKKNTKYKDFFRVYIFTRDPTFFNVSEINSARNSFLDRHADEPVTLPFLKLPELR